MLIIVVAFIFIKWKKDSGENSAPYMGTPAIKNPMSPSFIMPNKNNSNEQGAQAPTKLTMSMQETLKHQSISDESKNTEPSVPETNTQTMPVINKTEPMIKTQILDEAYQDKPQEKSIPTDPPWIKKETPQELIKPTAPPPKPTPSNLPWQKQNDDNEQPPGPMVNI